MYKFLLFLNKAVYVLLFLMIEIGAFTYFSKSSPYTQAKMINLSNRLTGNIHTAISGVTRYFSLREENIALNAEIVRLRRSLTAVTAQVAAKGAPYDSLEYTYTTARVVNNSINHSKNFITLDKGFSDGVVPDMAVLSGGAIVGYVKDCNEKFAVAVSVLNTKFHASGKLAGTDYAGALLWDGLRYDEMVLTEISKYAPINIGDTILTTAFSSIFPPDALVGEVTDFELVNGTYYQARIRLFAEMGGLNNVVLVKYEDLEEKREIEEIVMGEAEM